MLFIENKLWRGMVGAVAGIFLAVTLILPVMAIGLPGPKTGPAHRLRVQVEDLPLAKDVPVVKNLPKADLEAKGMVTPPPRLKLKTRQMPEIRVAAAPKTVPAATPKKVWKPAPAPSYRIPLRPGDMELLARLVHAEAGGESYAGKVAVAAVVINRVQSGRYPSTVKGVIFQRHAFEPVSNGRIWTQPTESSYRAVKAALKGWDPSGSALFFFAPAKTSNAFVWSRTVITRIGGHIFSR